MATEEEFGSSDWCRAFCVILLVGGVVGVTGSYALDSLIGLIEPDLPPARLGPSMLCGLAFGSLRVWHMLLRYLAFPFGFCGDLVSEVLGALLVPPSLLRHAWAWGPITHLAHGSEVLQNLTILSMALQQLLRRHRRERRAADWRR